MGIPSRWTLKDNAPEIRRGGNQPLHKTIEAYSLSPRLIYSNCFCHFLFFGSKA